MTIEEALPFVGREDELAAIMQSWKYTKLRNRPHLVVLRGDSGFGKTRLIHEFYANVVRLEQGDNGVWPPSLGTNRYNMEINPVPKLEAAPRLPFLWWGTRLSDTTERNRNSTSLNPADLISLEVLTREIANKAEEKKAAQDVLKAGLSFIPGVGSVTGGLDVVGSVVHLAQTLKSGRFSQDGFSEHRNRKMTSSLAAVVDQLDQWIRLDNTGSAPPSIIVLDDAHFLEPGGDAFGFFETLFKKAVAGGWNTLFIISVWPRGGETFEKLSSLFQHSEIIDVGKLGNIAQLFQRYFPGLEIKDLHELSERADGNPLLAYEMIKYVKKNSRLFTDNNVCGGLSDVGRQELWLKEFQLEELIEKRFDEADESTTFAVAVCSVQGIEFLELLGADLALELGRDGLPIAAFDNAADPEYFIARRRDGISEFPHRAYQIEAGKRLRNYAIPVRVENALKVCLSKALDKYKDKLEPSQYILLANMGCAVFDNPTTDQEKLLLVEYEYLRWSNIHLDFEDQNESIYASSEAEKHYYKAIENHIDVMIEQPSGIWKTLISLSSANPNIVTVSKLVKACENGGLDIYQKETIELAVPYLLKLAANLWHVDKNDQTVDMYCRAREIFTANSDMTKWKNRLNLAAMSVGTFNLAEVDVAIPLITEILDLNDEWLESERQDFTERFNIVKFLEQHWENQNFLGNKSRYDALFQPKVICQILDRDLENVSSRASPGFSAEQNLDFQYFEHYLLMLRRLVYIIGGSEVIDGSVSYNICLADPLFKEIDDCVGRMLVHLF